jgi:L-methionine (R)-S-oxide reductase
MKKGESFSSLLKEVSAIVASKLDKEEKLLDICKLLRNGITYYDWVGFYFVNSEKQNELLLGPFEGEPTEHVRIPYGRGICGQAAKTRQTFIVQDVSKEKNYLSCNINVKAEIVTPIFKNRKVIGELDIDSHTRSPFTREDEAFLNKIAKIISKIL